MEDLSDASFLGKLLVLPANVILDWKVIARCKHSSLFDCDKEKSFITLTPDGAPAVEFPWLTLLLPVLGTNSSPTSVSCVQMGKFHPIKSLAVIGNFWLTL